MKKGNLEWGFDLTDFGSRKNFEKVLMANRLKRYRKITKTYDEGKRRYYSYNWYDRGLSITTGNNPITGVYSQPRQRPIEPGYASYIGIEGKPTRVVGLVSSIKKRAKFVKGESAGKREFI